MALDREIREATVAYAKTLRMSTLITLMVNKEAIRQAVSKARGQEYADSLSKEYFIEIADICADEVDRRISLFKAEVEPAQLLPVKAPGLWERFWKKTK